MGVVHLPAGDKVTVEEKSLVKLTREELDEINKALKCGLVANYSGNNWIYQVKKDGSDDVFKGLDGKLNQEVEAPYLVCTVHTEEAWNAYLASIPETPPENPEGGENENPGDIEIPFE